VCSIAAELYVLRESALAERLQRMIYDHTHPGISRRFIAGSQPRVMVSRSSLTKTDGEMTLLSRIRRPA
jgi:hypothetical protein